MPIYEYRCTKGHTFEVMQSINDDPLKVCEVCGRPVERVLHSPAIHFKGSGFYNTDYGTKKRQREKSAASSESSSSDSSSDSSSTTSTEKTSKSESASTADAKTSKTEKPKPSSSGSADK